MPPCCSAAELVPLPCPSTCSLPLLQTSTVASSSTFVSNFLMGCRGGNFGSVGQQSMHVQPPCTPQTLDRDHVSTTTWAAQQLLGLRSLPPSIASASATVTRTPGRTTFTILGRPKASSGR
jgi:hypothetical protein